MFKKTTDIKNYLGSIGKTEQLHIFVGDTTSSLTNSTDEAAKELWRSVIFTKRVSRDDVVGVIPNIPWVSGNVYNPWSSTKNNSGAYYAWNRENGNVYVCLGNNEFNRDDLSGTISSTFAPTHSYGIKTYGDGYTWLPIYRITGDYLRFVKTEWIPVVSFEDYNTEAFSTEFAAADSFCDGNYGLSGFCSVYFKDNQQIPISGVTNDYYEKGELYKTVECDCSECYFMFKQDPMFTSVFYSSQEDIASTIPVYTKLEQIRNKVGESNLSSSSAFYAL